MKASLSVAYATFNEEHIIAQSIKSVYSLADEIIVYDAQSTDNTVNIIRDNDPDKKIKIIEGPNHEMFHVNKQEAIDACDSDWILQMDADELLSPELHKEINGVLTHDSEFNGFWMPRRNHFMGRPLMKGGQYPDLTIRLYRNGKGHLPCKTIHEQAEIEGGTLATGHLKHDLLHFPYPSFAAYIRKTLMYGEKEFTEGEDIELGTGSFINYFCIKPTTWFLMTYFRHKGFMDGFPGFVFSLFSSIRFWFAYCSAWESAHGKIGRL